MTRKQPIKGRIKQILIAVTLIEIIAIGILFVSLNKKTLNTVDVFTLNKKYYLSDLPQSKYKYFYELRTNLGNISDLTSTPSWQKTRPVYHINKDGLNSYTNYSIKKQKDTYRILALGDSFTFGLFLSTQYAWPQVLEKELNENLHCSNIKHFEVINLGVGGYDLPYEAERFRLKGAKYKPDLVIWLLKDEDFEWIDNLLQPILNTYNINNLSNTQAVSVTGLNFWKKAQTVYDSKYSKEYSIAYTNKALLNMGKTYHNKLLIINLPQYSTDPSVLQTIINFVQSRKNTYFDNSLPDILSKGGTFPETHPNRDGDKMIANSLLSYLRNKILPCKNEPPQLRSGVSHP